MWVFRFYVNLNVSTQTKRVAYILKQFLLVHIHKAEGRPLKREESQPLFTKKEKKETYKITILSIFIDFVFICKRICDISEIQDDEGVCSHWWDHNHRNFKAKENMLLILFSEQTWWLQTGLQFIWHHLNVIKVQDLTMTTEGINKVDLRWFD